MNEIAPAHPPQFHLTRWFWIGVATFVTGSGPLLMLLLLASLGVTKDPNPNPIGLGIMAFLTFWPSVGVILWQLGTSFFRYLDDRKRFQNRVAEPDPAPKGGPAKQPGGSGVQERPPSVN